MKYKDYTIETVNAEAKYKILSPDKKRVFNASTLEEGHFWIEEDIWETKNEEITSKYKQLLFKTEFKHFIAGKLGIKKESFERHLIYNSYPKKHIDTLLHHLNNQLKFDEKVKEIQTKRYN